MDRRMFLGCAAGFACAPFACGAGDDDFVLMRDLYNKDLSFSEFARSNNGQPISVKGFMAPPLKAESSFFVLTKQPMSVCPFCEAEAEWPSDILAVYAKHNVKVLPFNVPIVTHGILALNTYEDPETGFVSRVRLVDANYERL